MTTKIKHIAIIMDGNGRWASSYNLKSIDGHRAGAETALKIIEACLECGIKYLTLYAFSTENWSRPKNHIDELMQLIAEYIGKHTNLLTENDIKLKIIGDISKLDVELQDKLKKTCQLSKNLTGLQVNVALNYGGRDEIVRACHKMYLEDISNGSSAEFSEARFASYLDSADTPDPDLIIRTGGDKRLSNFLLWQAAYSELYFCEKLWPNFTKEDLLIAIEDYNKRVRKYGKTE